MKKKSFFANNRTAIFCLCFIASFLIVAIPQGVMCTGLFSNSQASSNAMTAIAGFFEQWAWAPFLVFIIIAAFAHNSKVKWAFLGSALFVLVAYVICKNIEVVMATADEIVSWFGTTGTTQ